MPKGQKAQVKMSQKKVEKTEKVEDVENPQEEKKTKKRHFIVTYNNEEMTASPSGERPKQAANKALTAIIKKYNTDNSLLNKELYFTLTERKKQKKDKHGNPIPNRIFHYIGIRTKIDINDPKYLDSQKEFDENGVGIGIKIPHKMFIKCATCKARENKLIEEAKKKGEKIIKKNIPKDDKCKSCKKEEKFIVYEYTNKVRKAPKTQEQDKPEEPKKEPVKRKPREKKQEVKEEVIEEKQVEKKVKKQRVVKDKPIKDKPVKKQKK